MFNVSLQHVEGPCVEWCRVNKLALKHFEKKTCLSSRHTKTVCGSHPQAGAVGVSSHHGEAVSRLVAAAHRKGDDAGEIPGHKILKTKPRNKFKYHQLHNKQN